MPPSGLDLHGRPPLASRRDDRQPPVQTGWLDLKRRVRKTQSSCTLAAAPLRLERSAGQGAAHPRPRFPEARAGGPRPRRSPSAAVLLLDAGHQLLLRVVIGDGRLPLGPLVAAAWGSAGQKHRLQVRRQDVAFRVVISAGQSHGPCAEF